MYRHEFPKRVRYGETDQMGYLYYGQYAQYYEIGRVEMLRALGLTYKEMEEEYGILMPVVHLEMRFVRPARYDELLTIRTELRKMPDRFIIFHVEIYNEKGMMVNGGRVRFCFVEEHSVRSIPYPSFLTEKLQPFFQSEKDPANLGND